MSKNKLLTIEKLAFGGAGFGRVDGKACFVPFTAPGDLARIKVVREKRSYLEGELCEVVEPGPDRVPPPCPVFSRCGGCDWQHVSYERQLTEKQQIFGDLLWRGGRVAGERLLPIVAAPENYGYRSRLQLKLRRVAGILHMGFYRSGSHFVIDIGAGCAIAHPRINELCGELRILLAGFAETDKIPQIDISVGDDGDALVIFHYIGDRHHDANDFFRSLERNLSSPVGVYVQNGRKSTLTKLFGSDCLSYRCPEALFPGSPEMTLSFSPGAFSQINFRQNLRLMAKLWEWLGLTGTERVLDLYCGNGNFSIPLARYVAHITGIEVYEPSVADAMNNCIANDISNCLFYCADVEEEIKRLATACEKFDIVLLDPPRNGAADIVGHLPALKPRVIVYVSCDPATLARDIGILTKSGFEVVKSCPLDMFPQTYHMESLTLLQPA